MNVRRRHRLRNDLQARSLEDKVARLERILGAFVRTLNDHTESLDNQFEINKEVFNRVGHLPANSDDMKTGYDFAFDTIETDHKMLENRVTMLEEKSEIVEEILEVELG